MTATKMTFDQKIDNLQHQIDTGNRGDSAFKGYVHTQLDLIGREMATKDDLYKMEGRLRGEMATKDDMHELRGNVNGLRNDMNGLRASMATKDEMNGLTSDMNGLRGDLNNLTKVVAKMGENLDKVAEKVDVLAQGVDGLIKSSKLTP